MFLGEGARVVAEEDGVAVAEVGGLGPVSPHQVRGRQARGIGGGGVGLSAGWWWLPMSGAPLHRFAAPPHQVRGLLPRGTVLPWRRWVVWAPCPRIKCGTGKHGASEGEGWVCWLVGGGCRCRAAPPPLRGAPASRAGVVAEADGVAVAEVGGLGPVSSTGHREGGGGGSVGWLVVVADVGRPPPPHQVRGRLFLEETWA